MPTPPLSEEDKQAALAAFEQYGNKKDAAAALGLNYNTFHHRLRMAQLDPSTVAAMAAVGANAVPVGYWSKATVPDENGILVSAYFKVKGDEEREDFREQIARVIKAEVKPRLDLPARFSDKIGGLLVLDPADVHIGKLSTATETGYVYDSAVAEHRLVEGCKALIDAGIRNGITHVLFVIGNDIIHIDNAKKTTTSGTPQDTDGTVETIYLTAQTAYERVILYALENSVSVQLVHVPSNHDWILGWTLAQRTAARFHGHPNVIATDYAISMNHRKYVRFGNNLILLSHGDGVKESDLPQVMLREARQHMAECNHVYAYLHHYHHKIKKALGIRPMAREKDHAAMTVMRSGAGAMEGDNVQVEYVRSPSAPDGWHHRNGYLNAQAVEAFIHCPRDGQKMRITEWF